MRDLTTGAAARREHGWSKESRLAMATVLGTIPVGIVGFLFRHQIEGVLTKSIPVIIGSLIGLALLLWLAEKVARHERTLDQVGWLDAILVGCAQAMALIPGSSRSGTTITAGLFLGFKREAAARFSFLLSLPAVLASGLYELYKIAAVMQTGADVFHFGMPSLVVATVVSGYIGVCRDCLAAEISHEAHHDGVRLVPDSARYRAGPPSLCWISSTLILSALVPTSRNPRSRVILFVKMREGLLL